MFRKLLSTAMLDYQVGDGELHISSEEQLHLYHARRQKQYQLPCFIINRTLTVVISS